MSRRAAGFLLITYAALVGALYMALRYAPPERVMGNVHRIFYFHVAAAWVGFLAFALVFVASLAYLRRPQARWDRLAAAAAELGVLFTTITLVMGSLWARAVWGVWWTWDPKLTTTLILWFLYVGYLLIRAAVDEPASRGRYAAVLGIAGFLNVACFQIFSAFAQLNGATSRVVILTYSMPIWTTIMSRFLLGERLNAVRRLAIALCAAGDADAAALLAEHTWQSLTTTSTTDSHTDTDTEGPHA